MLPVLQEVQRKYPDLCRITEVHDVPYARYQQLMLPMIPIIGLCMTLTYS